MKTSAKSIFGVMLSIAWLFAYAGGGAFVLARHAMANLDHVSPYIPAVIFLWVIGFFIGHSVIENIFLFVFKTGNSGVSIGKNFNSQINIDILPNISVPAYAYAKPNTRTLGSGGGCHYNSKKNTSKIYVGMFKSAKTNSCKDALCYH